jgi:hypothetical protein
MALFLSPCVFFEAFNTSSSFHFQYDSFHRN